MTLNHKYYIINIVNYRIRKNILDNVLIRTKTFEWKELTNQEISTISIYDNIDIFLSSISEVLKNNGLSN